MAFHSKDPLISRMTRVFMSHGRIRTAQKIIDGALTILKTEMGVQEPVKLLYQAVENVKPLIETRSMVIGARKIPVPRPVNPERQEGLAFRYLRTAMRNRKEYGSDRRLANELMAASKKEGEARKTRDYQHITAEANRIFVR
mmetsp:Transcript_18694/g.32459  ORF Transcript_18694/g.32459 Transcript_18694/m.32459 type:complete len:142 (-) Transcript_18694:43-468(-)